MSIYKNSMGSKQYIKPIGSTTLTAGPDTLLTINLDTFGAIRNIAVVVAGATITGAAVVTWYGGTTTGGGTLTAIAAITIPISGTTGVLQIDAEDIGYAQDQAGVKFKSLVLKIDGTNTDAIKSCVVANTLHEEVGLTPSSVTALT